MALRLILWLCPTHAAHIIVFCAIGWLILKQMNAGYQGFFPTVPRYSFWKVNREKFVYQVLKRE